MLGFILSSIGLGGSEAFKMTNSGCFRVFPPPSHASHLGKLGQGSIPFIPGSLVRVEPGGQFPASGSLEMGMTSSNG